ncbi:hypothetical protein COT49_01055 [candidate division WWE3 bacterium CG08_land_8_20_14_0_20_40_13]|uniref:Erythromycin biosynthesis sensory transduction protein eryC1 n=1 Tax=candidate division WWE3 bacterium CG08_land_8_20_14_0_20_40_13 TaxID=1975084 RepID=A0A2H0XEA5_UNCKA|nr:MAG: hypothetical protein COT49_01055 [candidate division WWE3 bacterium CG08_land_8_20_14_0_20_40_13]
MINWFVDFKKELKEVGQEVKIGIDNVMESGRFVMGPKVAEFEKAFANYVGVKYAVGVGNGTDAISIALQALDLSKGSGVLTTPLTATYTGLAINMAGLTPVFSDIGLDLNLNHKFFKLPKILKSSDQIKAVLPVHLYGNPCEISAVGDFCVNNGAYLVEDCAQAHGANYQGKIVGTFGDLGCFSFYPTKNLGAYGDGGAIVTNDEDIYFKLRMIREGGQSEKYRHDILGVNSRLDEIQAAVLLVKLKFLDKWTARRKEIAKYYLDNLAGVGDIRFPKVNSVSEPVYHLFVILTSRRDELAKLLSEKEIKTGVHYPIPLHLQKCFSYLGYKKGDFPEAERASCEVLSIPMHPYLTDIEIEEVVWNIKGFWK